VEDQDQLEEPTLISEMTKRLILAVANKNAVQEKLGIHLKEQEGVFCVSKISAKSPFQKTELHANWNI
jgi:predicted metalloprotease with PDZ domain